MTDSTKSSDILILSLMSGEQIIAEVAEHGGAYLCSNVLQILTNIDQESGQVRMGLAPYLPFSDPDAGIAIPTNMAIVAVPSNDFRNHYAEKFGMIITPPTPKIIVG